MKQLQLAGYTKPGFEAVRDTVLEHQELLGDGGAAFAATVKGELVVDLWAGQADQDCPWSRNTRVHIQSTSKAVTAMAAMLLVERGQLSLGATVGEYWPEYACKGKENTTVRMLLSHSAGSTQLPGYTELLDLHGNGLDQYEEIARRLAAAEPDWEPGTAHAYHAYTYGNLVSELVFRVSGKRAGELFRDEIAGPWNLNIFLGTPLAEQSELARIMAWPPAPMIPAAEQAMAQMAAQQQELSEEQQAMMTAMMDPAGWQYNAGFRGLLGAANDEFFINIGKLWNQPKALAAEFGAANATADARSLARLYQPLANGGVLDGKQVFSDKTVTEFITPTQPGGVDLLLGREQRWTPGSHHTNISVFPGVPPIYGPNPDAFGMSGGGGNYGFADPLAGVSAGFVRNHYSNDMGFSALLVESLYGCLK